MSMAPKNIGRIKTFIRETVSPRMTSLYARTGFAHRGALTGQLHCLAFPDQQYALNLLASEGVLKGRFRAGLTELGQIQEYMLSGRVTQEKLFGLGLSGIDTTKLFGTEAADTLTKMVQGINQGLEYVGHSYFGKKIIDIAPFALGIVAAVGIGLTLSGAAGIAALGTASIISYAAIKTNDRFPASGPYSVFGQIGRTISSKVAPLVYAADGAFVGKSVFDTNLYVPSIFESMGMMGTIATLGAIAGTMTYFVAKNLAGLRRSFGQHVDPGQKFFMSLLMGGTALSIAGEIHYVGTRVILLGAAITFILLNTVAAFPLALALLPVPIPLIGLAHTGYLRSKSQTTFASPEEAQKNDNRKIYTPLNYVGYGLISAGLLTAGGLLGGLGIGALLPAIAYSTLYGSLGTLLLNELHGSFHTINTNFGAIRGMQTSARDPIGRTEQEQRSRNASVFIINPHTRVKEHTFGVYFTLMLNQSPEAFMFCCYDYIIAEKEDNLKNHRNDRAFISWVASQQQAVFNILAQGLTERSGSLSDRYQQLATNLEKLAAAMESTIEEELRKKIVADGNLGLDSDLFETFVDVAEYRRAAFQELAKRAEVLREKARLIRLQAARPDFISESDLQEQWSYYLRCYDPEFIRVIPISRKNKAGDEREVRKVENVASLPLVAGTRIYKGFWLEQGGDRAENAPQVPIEEWIPGTWTQVKNPRFSYFAPTELENGTPNPAASKYVWVRVENTLTPLQLRHKEKLSSSRYISFVENEPTTHQGFIEGNKNDPLIITVHGKAVTISDYYFAPVGDPDRTPEVTGIQFREEESRETLPQGYELAYEQGWPASDQDMYQDMSPASFTVPVFDYTLMMDKNDIEIHTSVLLPSLIDRERDNKFLNLIIRYPVEDLQGTLEVADPQPKKELDLSQGIQVVDANIELSYFDAQEVEHVIPYKIDRAAAHAGFNKVDWKLLREARIETDERGEIVLFQLIYRKGVNNGILAFLGNRQAQIWEALINAGYIDRNGAVLPKFSKDKGIPAVKGLNREERTRIEAKLKEGDVSIPVTLPPTFFPAYFRSLEIGPNQKIKLKANNFTLAPQREGDMSWLKITYTDGTVSFTRVPDGQRPILFNKDLELPNHE